MNLNSISLKIWLGASVAWVIFVMSMLTHDHRSLFTYPDLSKDTHSYQVHKNCPGGPDHIWTQNGRTQYSNAYVNCMLTRSAQDLRNLQLENLVRSAGLLILPPIVCVVILLLMQQMIRKRQWTRLLVSLKKLRGENKRQSMEPIRYEF